MDSTTISVAGVALAGADAVGSVKIEAATNLTIDAVVIATDDVLLDANAGDLTINTDVRATDDISLVASDSIAQNADGDVTAGGFVEADAEGDSITMADGAETDAGGNIQYLAATNVVLGGLAGANVRVESTAGSITDGGDTDTDVEGTDARSEAPPVGEQCTAACSPSTYTHRTAQAAEDTRADLSITDGGDTDVHSTNDVPRGQRTTTR